MKNNIIKLSLVLTSRNRKKELLRFIESLNTQQNVDLSSIQLIFVDQEDNRDILKNLNPLFKFNYVQTSHCSLSHARTIGLQYVEGKYLGFPDDDCWYEDNTLIKVLNFFQCNDFQGLTGKGTNGFGKLTSIFPQESRELTITNRCAAISYTIFVLFNKEVFFDENLGVGSPYNLGSGEETDYLLTLMEKYNYQFYYDSTLIIHHPASSDANFDKISLLKVYSYARGNGYLMQKHKFPLLYYMKYFIRPLLGMLYGFVHGRKNRISKSYYILRGRLEGFLINVKRK